MSKGVEVLNQNDTTPMEIALEEARAAGARGEVPIGAVIVHQGTIIARAGNRTRELNDVTAHAEVLAIREAGETLQSETSGWLRPLCNAGAVCDVRSRHFIRPHPSPLLWRN